MLDFDVFTRGMFLLQRAVPTFKPVEGTDDAPGTLEAFYELLKDLEPDVFKAAISRVATDEEFVSVRAIRKAAESLMYPTRRSGVEAWGDVVKQVHEVGYLHAPEFSDPLVAQVVRAMGWRNICLEGDFMVTRAHFIKSYEQVSEREHNTARQIPEVRARIEDLSGPQKIGDVLKRLSGKSNGE